MAAQSVPYSPESLRELASEFRRVADVIDETANYFNQAEIGDSIVATRGQTSIDRGLTEAENMCGRVRAGVRKIKLDLDRKNRLQPKEEAAAPPKGRKKGPKGSR